MMATRATFIYAYPLDRLLHALKYNAQLAYADYFAAALADSVDRWPDVMAPIPLAPARQRERGFNQSEEIAKRLSRRSGVPVVAGLVRTRDTPAQASLPWQARAGNARDVFAALPLLAGQRVAIVDDVMTTGSTMAAAAKAALRAGATHIEAWVVARTLPPAQSP